MMTMEPVYQALMGSLNIKYCTKDMTKICWFFFVNDSV